jgi:hypothetical protein
MEKQVRAGGGSRVLVKTQRKYVKDGESNWRTKKDPRENCDHNGPVISRKQVPYSILRGAGDLGFVNSFLLSISDCQPGNASRGEPGLGNNISTVCTKRVWYVWVV